MTEESKVPVCLVCRRLAILICAGDAEVWFHIDDSTPVVGCQREPLPLRTDKQVLADVLTDITNRIELIPGQPVTAKHHGPHAAEVVRLFGTDTIPCPWDSREPREDILAEIKKRNPGCVVYWKGTL